MYRPYDVVSGKCGTAQEEWAPHETQTIKSFEWWYLTNVLKNEKGDTIFQHIMDFQWGGSEHSKLLNVKEGKGYFRPNYALHNYDQKVRIWEATFGKMDNNYDPARNAILYNADGFVLDWAYQGDKMTIVGNGKRHAFDLKLTDTQGVLWHKDKIFNIEGLIAESAVDEPSFYYSLPTLEVEGTITYTDKSGKEVTERVTGQGWCDRQWGDYTTKSWEWCSMRFFDGDRVNLYAFPQTGHKIGSYMTKDKKVSYFDNFMIAQKTLFQVPNGAWLTSAWEYELPIKEGKYFVRASSEDDFMAGPNTLIETLGLIYDQKGELVGYTANESMDINVTKTGPGRSVI